MAQLCDQCGQTVYRTRFQESSKKFVGLDCGCLREIQVTAMVNSPYSDLTLQHVHDEYGKPVRVTSIHQLREAEKRYGFKHHVANMNHENIDVAPTHRTTTVGDHYNRKFRRY